MDLVYEGGRLGTRLTNEEQELKNRQDQALIKLDQKLGLIAVSRDVSTEIAKDRIMEIDDDIFELNNGRIKSSEEVK